MLQDTKEQLAAEIEEKERRRGDLVNSLLESIGVESSVKELCTDCGKNPKMEDDPEHGSDWELCRDCYLEACERTLKNREEMMDCLHSMGS